MVRNNEWVDNRLRLNFTKEIQFDGFHCSEDTITLIVNRFYHELVDSNVKDIIIKDNSISFQRGIFRTPGEQRTLFNLISNGEITVKLIEQKVVVYYSFDFSHLFFTVLIMVLLLPLLSYIGNGSKLLPLSFYLFSTFAGFVWLFGVSVWITLVRFKMMAKRIIKKCCLNDLNTF